MDPSFNYICTYGTLQKLFKASLQIHEHLQRFVRTLLRNVILTLCVNEYTSYSL